MLVKVDKGDGDWRGEFAGVYGVMSMQGECSKVVALMAAAC